VRRERYDYEGFKSDSEELITSAQNIFAAEWKKIKDEVENHRMGKKTKIK
jgi:hypothetical protein